MTEPLAIAKFNAAAKDDRLVLIYFYDSHRDGRDPWRETLEKIAEKISSTVNITACDVSLAHDDGSIPTKMTLTPALIAYDDTTELAAFTRGSASDQTMKLHGEEAFLTFIDDMLKLRNTRRHPQPPKPLVSVLLPNGMPKND